MNKYDWIIGICCSEADGVRLFRFHGTKNDTKEKLLSLIKEDRTEDEENWDDGCECIDDIITAEDNEFCYELYGYGCYSGYHIDYTAKEFSHIEMLGK